ncbi:MAG: hypothetical protein KDD04_09410, partial [Sinomicrobium sp.]|nr:hypothetical protein [Sinomicrobium sp.]
MDIQRVLQDLEARVVGLKPDSDELREGLFVSFRKIGLPVREQEYKNGFEDFFVGDPEALVDATAEVTPNAVPECGDGVDGLDAGKMQGAAPLSPEMNYLRTFVLSDDKIKMTHDFAVESAGSRISDTWEAILTGAAIAISEIEENETVAQAFKALEKKITPEMIAKMDRAETQYNNALEELVEKYTESRYEGQPGRRKWMQLGKMYQRKADRYAKAYRIASGEYNKITAMLDAHGADPTGFLISKAKTHYENWRVQLGASGSAPYTFMSPSDWYSPYAPGWTTYTEKQYNENVRVKSSTRDFDVKSGLSNGIWSVGPKGGYNRIKEQTATGTDGLNIAFDYLVAKVNRPWMDTSFLQARNWYLKSGSNNKYPAGCISDGTFGQRVSANGHVFLPAIITRLVLI